MKTKSFLSLTFALALAVALCAMGVPAFGQEVTANIVGTVTDPSGAPIAGADATATDTQRGTAWKAKTDATGTYNILRLPISTYDVKVTAAGFQTAERAAFTLQLNQTARVDVQMKVGQVSETIEVTSAEPLLQTESTEVSTDIDAHAVTSVPLAGRNYLQLGLLAPGTTTNNPKGINEPQNLDNGARPFINGNREQANQYFLDGILNSEDKNNETSYVPNVDAIQEFNIITQNASAEFGNYEGGVVSVSTKSGTNNFHGSVYEFFRNDKLDANNAANGWSKGVTESENTAGHIRPGHAADGSLLKPEFRYNEFGVTFGGPIVKNKLFFFADYQGLRDLNAGATGAQLLTKSMRGGDFGQLCTQFGGAFDGGGNCTGGTGATQLVDPLHGNAVVPFNNFANTPDTISGVASTLFTKYGKYYPLPQIDNVAGGNNYFYNTGNSINMDQGDLKIDYAMSDTDHIFGRWSQAHLRNPVFSGCIFCAAGSAQGADQPMRNAVLNWSHVFSPHLLNEARFGFNAVQFNQNLVLTSSLGNVGRDLGIAGANFELPGLLNINVTPAGSVAANADLGQLNLVQNFHTTQGQLNDNLAITSGRHSVKVGFQFVRLRQDFEYNGNNGGLGSIPVSAQSGSALADLYLGLAAAAGSGGRDTYIKPGLFKHRGNIYAAYVQDNWHVTSNLTLNLGVRFEDHTPLIETQNRMVNFGLLTGTIYTPDAKDGTAKFSNRGLYNNYLGIGDWEPRLGFAWSPSFLGGKTVIRGGYAISSFFEGGGTNEQLTMNPPLGIYNQHIVGGTLANGFPDAQALAAGCLTVNVNCYAGTRIRLTDQNFKPAMSQQWNLTIQHQLSNTLTLQLGYVGQHGTHLLNFEDLAQRVGLNASGKIAKPGEQIVSQRAGPYLGGGSVPCDNASLSTCGAAQSLYLADQNGALAGANMSNSNQRYDALQAVLQKRAGNGLQAQVAYTYSKCLSNSPGYFGTGWGSTGATSSGGQPGPQNIYDPRSDWGPCFYDQTHVLTSYVTYQLPVGRGKQFGKDMNPIMNAVIGNWEVGGIVSLHSGNALTLNEFGGWGAFNGDPSNTNSIGPSTLSERPNCNGPIHVVNRRVAATASAPAYIQWFDPSNVSHPSKEFGTCSVGNIRGPRFANLDFSLNKNFVIAEGKQLQFRFEALNAFNHPVWTFSGGPAGGSFDPGTPVVSTTGNPTNNPNFGNITGSQSARSLQLALKFIF
jgi:carboxypeptidase family protein/TonB-dependent receptor-like protein